MNVVFPRVTMCDFRVRRLGNVHRYTVQCVLPINLYTEKIYLFLWFWMIFVAVASIVGFITWLLRVILRSDRVTYAKNHLKVSQENDDFNEQDLNVFVDHYLQQDGVFLMRLIGHNTNSITVTEIMEELYTRFLKKQHIIKPQAPPNPDDGSANSNEEKQPLSS